MVPFVPPQQQAAIKPPQQQAAIKPPQQQPAIEPPRSQQNILRLGVLADRYLKIPAIRYDHAYGIKPVEGSTNFSLGRMDVKIDGDGLIIDEEKYKGTEGLWKLLTLKEPANVTSEDLEVYKKMMQQTKAFLYDWQDRVKCNRGKKFKDYIKPISNEWKESAGASRASYASSPQITPLRPVIQPRGMVTNASPLRTPTFGYPSQMERDATPELKTGKGLVAFYTNPKELEDKLLIKLGSLRAGNTSTVLKNDIRTIFDEMLDINYIAPKIHKSVFSKYKL